MAKFWCPDGKLPTIGPQRRATQWAFAPISHSHPRRPLAGPCSSIRPLSRWIQTRPPLSQSTQTLSPQPPTKISSRLIQTCRISRRVSTNFSTVLMPACVTLQFLAETAWFAIATFRRWARQLTPNLRLASLRWSLMTVRAQYPNPLQEVSHKVRLLSRATQSTTTTMWWFSLRLWTLFYSEVQFWFLHLQV